MAKDLDMEKSIGTALVTMEFTMPNPCSYQDLCDYNMSIEGMVRHLYEEQGIGVFDHHGIITKVEVI